jgi:alpha(1,3/1,4) fucosyltransferase
MLATYFKYLFCLCILPLAIFVQTPIYASRNILVVPGDREGLDERIYRYIPPTSSDYLNYWQLTDKTLRSYDLKLQPSDLSEFSSVANTTHLLKTTEKILFYNLPTWIPNWKEKLAKLPKEKLILITFEPPAVLPEMFLAKTFDLFDKVLTWDDSLVDNVKFFKFNYVAMYPMIGDIAPFSEKKLLTQISGNKTSSHPHELYSKRLKVIRYFEKTKGSDFDFYGPGWEGLGFRNYKGKIDGDKTFVLKNYRFSICYENITNIKGYITEKIFGCFLAGVVPIYLGASNITDYIPANCFIAREKIPAFKKLVSYLKNMKEAEYNRYLENIRRYLKSEQAKQFTKEAFVDSVLKCLNLDNPEQ